jgi:hypothetical protein
MPGYSTPDEAVPRDAAGSVLRPNIFMFGDYWWDSSRKDSQQEGQPTATPWTMVA